MNVPQCVEPAFRDVETSRAWGTGLLLSKGFVALREAG